MPADPPGGARALPPLDGRALARLVRRAGRIALDRRRKDAAAALAPAVGEEIEDWLAGEVGEPLGLTLLGSRDGEARPAAGWTLAIDAIDDPLAYEAGMPTWSVALALLREGHPIAGAVYAPALNDLYVASGGRMRWQGRVVPSASTPATKAPAGLLLGAGELQRRSLLGIARRRTPGGTSYPISLVARGAAEGAVIGPASLRELAPGLALLEAVGGELLSLPRGRRLETRDLPRELSRGRTRAPLLAAAPGAGAALLRRLKR